MHAAMIQQEKMHLEHDLKIDADWALDEIVQELEDQGYDLHELVNKISTVRKAIQRPDNEAHRALDVLQQKLGSKMVDLNAFDFDCIWKAIQEKRG